MKDYSVCTSMYIRTLSPQFCQGLHMQHLVQACLFDLKLFQEKEVSKDASWSSLLAACNSPLLSIYAILSCLSLFQIFGNQHNSLLLTCFSKYTVHDAADGNLKSGGPSAIPCGTS